MNNDGNKNIKKVRVYLFKGKGIISSLIRWQTRGQYSHAAIQPEGRAIYESWQGGRSPGVRYASIGDGSGVDVYEIEVTNEQHEAITEFLKEEFGKGYDFIGVLRFLSRRVVKQNDKWFCSELVFCAFQHAGINLFNHTEGWEVSPQMLCRSTLLTKVSK